MSDPAPLPATADEWRARLAEQGVSEEALDQAGRTADGLARAVAGLGQDPCAPAAPLDLVPLLLARREPGA